MLKWLGRILLVPVTYLVVALVLSVIPISGQGGNAPKAEIIYLSTNGVHLDIILPRSLVDEGLADGLQGGLADEFLAFGWGDKEFYLNTPEWGDLKVMTALSALFLKSETLMHVSRYSEPQQRWVSIKVNAEQLGLLNEFINASFRLSDRGQKIKLDNKGYYHNDDFYEAMGSYSCLKTCNTWVNQALKESGIKACVWTPFDFSLLAIHKRGS